MIKLVIVESPYSGDVAKNIEYAKSACLDCIIRGENPFASHLFYPLFLDDGNETDRDTGIRAGYEWGFAAKNAHADRYGRENASFARPIIAFYTDLGWSRGMKEAFEYYTEFGFMCQIREVPEWERIFNEQLNK